MDGPEPLFRASRRDRAGFRSGWLRHRRWEACPPPRRGSCRRMPTEDLSSILWRECDLLGMLLFKLEVEQLVLTNGRFHWLPVSAREIETCHQQSRSVDPPGAVAVDTVAA